MGYCAFAVFFFENNGEYGVSVSTLKLSSVRISPGFRFMCTGVARIFLILLLPFLR